MNFRFTRRQSAERNRISDITAQVVRIVWLYSSKLPLLIQEIGASMQARNLAEIGIEEVSRHDHQLNTPQPR